MNEAFLSLGSNLGNKRENIERAIQGLKLLPETVVEKVSSIYETEPVEVPDEQDNYLNCCVKLSTTLEAKVLLGACLGIEASMGRIRTYRNAARIIDIDLLLYADLQIESKDLVLPHPRMWQREFVLVPLRELVDLQSIWNLKEKR